MRFRSIFLLVALLFGYSTANASTRSIDCLTESEPKSCFADLAFSAISKETNPSRSAEGFASLLNALSRANIKREDVFNASRLADSRKVDDYSRWALAMSRKNYMTRFHKDEVGSVSNIELERSANLLRRQKKANKSMEVITAACDIRDGMPDDSQLMWSGLLDRLCNVDASDIAALDKTKPSFSLLFVPLVNAYNHDINTFQKSITASFYALDLFEEGLKNKKMSLSDRDAIYSLLYFGHLLNASALALLDIKEPSVNAANVALEYLSKSPAITKNPTLQSSAIQVSWIYAKAGRDSDARKLMNQVLTDLHKASNADLANAYAMCIEALVEMKKAPII
jgi:hypothetical protein